MISVPVVYSALMANREAGSFSMGGPVYDNLALALARSLPVWISNPFFVSLSGNAVGTAGVGVISSLTSKLVLPRNDPLFLAGMLSSGFSGVIYPSLSTCLSSSIASVISGFGSYAGASFSVGAGADVSSVVFADRVSLATILLSNMSGVSIGGLTSVQLANGVAGGICNVMMTVTGAGVVTGPALPIPSAGKTISSAV